LICETTRANERQVIDGGEVMINDEDPPLVSSLLAGTGMPNIHTTYDLVGRQLFVALHARF
jgi:hypothetical protein